VAVAQPVNNTAAALTKTPMWVKTDVWVIMKKSLVSMNEPEFNPHQIVDM
jgi:hypothetical protein